MKRINYLFCIALLVSLMGFASCNKAAKSDKGIFYDGKFAVENANKNNNNILVIATMEGNDLYSADLINNVLKNPAFEKEVGKDYTVLHIDFSENSYKATVFNEDSTEEEKKIAEENAKRMQANTLLASRLNLQLTPEIYLMSKDMYYITKIDYINDQITDYEKFKTMIEGTKEVSDKVNAKIEATNSKNKMEKLEAIDELFESTDSFYRTFLIDLVNEYVETDKNNESGRLSKYIMAKADIESSNFFMAGDVGNAIKIYADAAETEGIEPKEKQDCYYLAGYLSVMAQSTDFELIKSYFEKAIEAYPEGENTTMIKGVLEQFNKILEAEKAAAASEQ